MTFVRVQVRKVEVVGDDRISFFDGTFDLVFAADSLCRAESSNLGVVFWLEGSSTAYYPIGWTLEDLLAKAGIETRPRGYQGACAACNFEAEFGTEACPHPVDGAVHTCPALRETTEHHPCR